MTIAIRGALQTGTSTAGANISVDLSLITGLAQGDVVLVFTALTTASMGTFDPIVTSANWNDCGLGRLLNSDSLRAIRCYWKVMGASPDTTVAINGTGTAGDATGAIAIAFSGVNPDNPLDATAVSTSGAAPANLLTITPGHNGALVIGAAVGAYDTSKSTISNYTLGARDTNATRGQSIGLAYRIRAATTGGAEDPPAWAANWAAGNWVAITMALNSTIKAVATALTTGSPVLGTPACTLTVFAPSPNEYTSASPVIDATPAFAKTAGMPVCVAGPFVTGSPTFGTPQVISPVAVGKTIGSPTFGTPQVISPVAVGKTIGSPTFGTPQVISPVAVGKTVGSPIFATPTVAVVVPCVATALTIGSPTFGAPNALSPKATGITVGSPTFGTPNALSPVATGLTVGSPMFGAPVLTAAAGIVAISPTDLVGDSPTLIDAPALTAVAGAVAADLAVGSPTFGIDWGAATGNYVNNNTMQGAALGVVGSGGAIPSGWDFHYENGAGPTYTIDAIGVDTGISFVEYTLAGATSAYYYFTAFTNYSPYFDGPGDIIDCVFGLPLTPDQATVFSFWYQVTNDDAAVTDITADISVYAADGDYLGGTSTSIYATRGSWGRRQVTAAPTGVGVYYQFNINVHRSSTVTDFRQKIGSPQFEVGSSAGTLVNTYGVSKLNQVHALAAAGLTVGSPALGTPNVVSTKAIGFNTASPAISVATLKQIHLLTATGKTLGAPVFGTPSIVSPVAVNLTVGALFLGTPVMGVQGLMAAVDLTIGSPSLGNPNVISPVAAGLTVGSPALGTPNVVSTKAVGFNTASPTIAVATLLQVHLLAAVGKTLGAPALGTPNVVSPVAVGRTVGSPVFGTPNVLSPVAIGFEIQSPTLIATPAISLVEAGTLTATDLVDVAPVFTQPTFSALNIIQATGLTVGSPSFGRPMLFRAKAANLTVGSPSFGRPILFRARAVDKTVGSPTFGAPALKKVLTATNLTVNSPSLGIPILFRARAVNLTVGSPSLGVGVASLRRTIAASNHTAAAPVLDAVPAFVRTTPQPVAINLTVGSPILGTPRIVSPIAVNLTIGSPIIDVNALVQVHKLIGAPLTVSTPSLAIPTLIRYGALDLTVGSPIIGVASTAHVNVLAASDYTTASPTIDAIPAFGKTFGATAAVDLTVGSPLIESLAFKQEHVIVASSLTTGSPIVGTAISADVEPPSVPGDLTTIELSEWATNLTTASPTIAVGALSENALHASSLTVGSPILGTPTLVSLEARGLTVGSPSFSSIALKQVHVLTANSLTTGSPSIGRASWSDDIAPPSVPADLTTIELSEWASNLTTFPPIIGAGVLKQTLSASSLTVGSPILETPALKKVLAATNLTVGSPTFGTPFLGSITVTGLTVGRPTLGTPQVISPVATGLTVGSPSIGVGIGVGVVALAPTSLVVGSPAIDSGVALQKHVLKPAALAIGSPDIGATVIGRVLGATNLTVGHPTFGLVGVVSPVAVGLAVGSPAIDTPSIGIVRVMTPTDVTVGRPAIDVGALAQTHRLVATDLTLHSPVFGLPKPAVGAIAEDLTVGSPVLGSTSLGKRLDATSLVVGSPIVGLPATSTTTRLVPLGLSLDAPTIGIARIGQSHKLVATGVTVSGALVAPASIGVAGHPTAVSLVVGRPEIAANLIVQNYKWQAYSTIVARPTISRAIMGVVCSPEATDLTVGQPTFGEPSLAIRIDAIGIEVGAPVLEAPTTHAISHFIARSLIVERPDIGVGYYQPWGGYHVCHYDAYYITTEYEVYFSPQDWEAFRLTDEDEVYPEGMAA